MNSRFVRHPEVLWRETSEGALILPPVADEPLALNGPAAMVWQLLGEPTGVTGLCEELGDIYRVDPTSIAADVRAVLDDLAEHGAIERAS